MSFAAPVPPKDASCTSCGDQKNPTQVCPLRVPGAVLIDQRPRCAVNAELVNMLYQDKVINSSYESRMFLQQNAEKYMNWERQRAMERLGQCTPCMRPFTDNGTMLPERYVVRCTPVSCDRTEVNPSGLGDGRSY